MQLHISNSLDLRSILPYCLILLPFFLISGPFLSDLVIFIFTISFFLFVRDKKFYKNYFFIFSVSFWIILVTSSLISDYKLYSLKSSFFYLRFCFFSLFIWYLLENNKNLLKKIFYILIISFSILIGDSLFQFFYGENILKMKMIENNRVSSLFGDELKLGGFLMRLTPLLFALSFYFYKKKLHKNYLPLCIIFLILIQITIFLSGERSSFFLFTFLTLLFLIFIHDFKFMRIIYFFSFILFLFLLLNSDSPFKKRIVNSTIDEMKLFKDQESKYIFSKQYHEHFISSWRIFNDNKIIGIGPKNFRKECKIEKYNLSELTCSTHPHNFPLQILSESGLLGFLFYLSINIIVWYSLFKSLFAKVFYQKRIFSNFQISLLIALAVLFFPFAPNGSFFNNWLSILVYYPFGFLLWSLNNNVNIYFNFRKKLKM